MRVLLINHFPLAGSGSGTYTQNIATHLVEKGHEACIIMPENTQQYRTPDNIPIIPVYFTNENTEEQIEGALPFNFPCFTTHPRSSQTFYDLSGSQLDAYIAAFEAATAKAVREFQPDVIHAQHVWVLAWVAMKTGLPYVITSHGTDIMGYNKSPRYRRYADEAAQGAGAIISISKDNVQLARETFPAGASKVVYQKNGYDPSLFFPVDVSKEEVFSEYGIESEPHVVFFAGKLADFKGVDVLLDAAKLYEHEHAGIATLIAGDGELLGELKAQRERNALKNVYFLGFIPITELRRLYSIADVAAVPSRREPFGLVAVEALACGCPVVATNQGGLPDIINSDVGSLVDVEDASALAEALQQEIFNPNRIEKGRYAARYAAENFSQSFIIDSLVDIYRSVL